MIIVRLVGGLGNQLFQYAAARSLSIYHSTELKFDISAFERYKLHKYSLTNFNVQEVFATTKEIEWIKQQSDNLSKKKNFWFFRVNIFKNQRVIFNEAILNPYNPDILKTPKHVYLDGYWQSEKYFSGIHDLIRKDITLKPSLSPESQRVADAICKEQSVSIHVRRGDYVTDKLTNEIHGICELDYYYQCIHEVARIFPRPHFFVFSDDHNWVIDNLKIDLPVTYVSHNDDSTNYEDLYLMSLCDHNIIANSSFSWWGAWLNSNPHKLIIGPKKWFVDENLDTRDLLPKSWVKI